ncbi:hypothetical protein [Nonomuraea sp. NPDC049141]|uniref:hypothetical protein n=1 Tax=Nonomuraea sp. NPDC049141 TaxID=3155500 RepID=UPI0033E70F1F
MEQWAKLIEAVGGLLTGLAWPVAVVLAVWLIMRRHNAAFGRLIDRVTSLQFPGGQIDLADLWPPRESTLTNWPSKSQPKMAKRSGGRQYAN